MLNWSDVKRLANQGNPSPDRTVKKADAEWQAQLTDEQYRVTRRKGTEQAFSSPMCNLFAPGLYACICCETLLFDSSDKFQSGTGWPSFTQPIKPNAVAYHADSAHGMLRIEATCNTCEAHLGHVFQGGPAPSGLRYCINAISLTKAKKDLAKATFGGGCFWCTEAIFKEIKGVRSVASGYSGGFTNNPSYRDVCNGNTGHAEVIQVTFDPDEINYADLVRLHLSSHDPTTLNQQGADTGTQYRSVILTHDAEQQSTAEKVIAEMGGLFDKPIVTEITPHEAFFKAEEKHQNYYADNLAVPYCRAVIDPKLKKFRDRFSDKLRS